MKKVEECAWVTQLFASDAKSLVELRDDLDEEIEEGDTTPEKAKKKMERKTQRVVDELESVSPSLSSST